MAVTRRRFLGGTLGAAGLLTLGACSDVHSGVGGGGGGGGSTASPGSRIDALAKVKGELTFGFWGGSAGETKGFTYVKDRFEAAHPGARITFKVVPYDGFFAGIDRGIQSKTAPDVFRVDYTTIGKYSSRDVLLDMTPYFTTDETKAFLPALWQAVTYKGVPYGVPHQTDTTCVVYDKDALKDAGITSVPDRLADAWTWEEFGAVAAKLRRKLPSDRFPFAYAWTQAGAFRWLSWLYQAGGTLLNDDLTSCALGGPAATKAMDFTKGFFTKKWVPGNNTVKTSQYSDNFFLSRTVPMTFLGDFLVPTIADRKNGYKGDWDATFMPRDTAAASDLGGNALVALKTAENPDLAAAFLRFVVQEDMMKYFCEQAIELPTLKNLASADLEYAVRPDTVRVFAQQATTITDRIVRESTVPSFAAVNTVLQDQLELAFHGQSSADTLKRITDGVGQALAG